MRTGLISLLLILSAGLVSADDNLSEAYKHRAIGAAIADTATTMYGLEHGLHELNPLGVAGTTLMKVWYFTEHRPSLGQHEQVAKDRMVGAALTGAAVNNIIQIIWGGPVVLTILAGAAVAWSIY